MNPTAPASPAYLDIKRRLVVALIQLRNARDSGSETRTAYWEGRIDALLDDYPRGRR